MNCTKAIIPVAGYGTRRLPITKAIEKCMLPVLNRPIIDYIVEDCVKAGVTDIYFVVSPDSTQLQQYYSQKPDLAAYLRACDKEEMVELIQPPENVNFHYIEQDTSPNAPYGTTIPVWLCREFIKPDEHVFVLTGDDFLYSPDGTSDVLQLKEQISKNGGAGLLAVEVPHEKVSGYGVIAAHDQDGRLQYEYIQERPTPEEAKSNLINISKYIFPADFFAYVDQSVQEGQTTNGEYYIIDVINTYAKDNHMVEVLPAKGTYLDGGTLENWVAANTYILEHQR